MDKKWLTLYLIIFMYLPVSIDATVLHVAVPRLSIELKASGEQLLWIIDIYSLIMAGLLLPMGVLCDHIGPKRLSLIGVIIFFLGSLMAALAPSVLILLMARIILAIGAAMILPATLAALRHAFTDEKERNLALGIWSSCGTVGAIAGPLVGGLLLEYFYWGAVFIINLPLLLMVLIITPYVMPEVQGVTQRCWHIKSSLLLIFAVLTLVYTLKKTVSSTPNYWTTSIITLLGIGLLYWFFRIQMYSSYPLLDLRLLTSRVILIGCVIALTTMVVLVGFELLITQELQFVFEKSPLEAALFLMPLMISSAISGPIVGKLYSYIGPGIFASVGMILSGLSLLTISIIDISQQYYMACFGMILLGVSIEASMLASTAAIMSSVSNDQAGTAGAIEGMAYELGSGLGVTFFGTMIYTVYASSLIIPENLPEELSLQIRSSIGETIQVVHRLEGPDRVSLMHSAREAFNHARQFVLTVSGIALIFISFLIGWFTKKSNTSK